MTGSLENKTTNIIGTYYKQRAIFNVIQFPHGNRYTPSKLRSNLIKIISSSNNNWIESTSKYFLGYTEFSMYLYKPDGQGNYVIVSSPSHDLNEDVNIMEIVTSGNLAIKEVVKQIISNPTFQSSNLKVLMPIAQSNNGRRHWTLLALDKNNGIWSASHLDSKGCTSSFYSLENMIQGLKDIKCSQIELCFLGHQGLMNLKDCPRYVISYIFHILQNKDPRELTNKEVEHIFQELPQ